MRLYLIRGCPYGHRAAMALREKRLEFELVFFEHGKRPEELEELGALAKSPTLFDGDSKVYDSHVVLEYLEDRYLEPRLMPQSAEGRAEVRMQAARMREQLASKYGPLEVEATKPHRDGSRLAEAERAFLEQLPSWDRQLRDRTFAVGDSLTIADITLYTFFPAIQSLSGLEVPEDCPHLCAWLDRIAARPSAMPPEPA